MLIQVRDLNKIYRTREGKAVHALKNITFEIPEGEFVSVVGPSGCGKSTMLKIISGILPKTSGEVLLRGTPVNGPRRDIGVVFQAPVLLPWRNVLSNVMVPAEIQNLERERYQERARELLRLVGLQNFESKYPNELSGGMQQRVGIARGLIHDPAILLMDEPFGALDAMTREYMNLELLRIWQESRKTIFFITHSIPEAVFLADRVLVLSSRPGCLIDTVTVNLPRPRAIDMMNSDRFGVHTSQIRRYFGSQGGLDA